MAGELSSAVSGRGRTPAHARTAPPRIERGYDLRPHVPRLILEWQDRDPGATHLAAEGTMAFLDLSGFTKMSERLARKGKVGAEEVARILNETFEELLGVAYEANGTLLKFGGDALLLFFSDPDHPVRACYAVHGMMRKLRSLNPIQSSAGAVRLKMSVGIHTGTFHYFLVGRSHRDFFVLGEDTTTTLEMEAVADGGEILLSAVTAAALDPKLVGDPKDGGRLLARPPVLATPTIPATVPISIDPAEFVSTAVRGHLLAGGHEPEHRLVSVAFLRFGDTDALLADIGPERLAERLELLVDAIQQVVGRYEICFLDTDVDKRGAKVLVTAGAPQATENDEERILRAMREIADGDYGLELKIGVNHGRAFAGAIGTPYRRCYTTIGDTTNTAARVMGKAPPGQVLATKWLVERSQGRFELTEVEPFAAKGKAKPIEAYSVGRPLGGQHKDTRELPLVGRDDEFARLVEATAKAAAGHGMAVEVVGEAGHGKSRLISELVARAPVDVHVVTCERYESTTPYFTVRSLLRLLLGASALQRPSALRRKVAALAPGLEPWLPLLGTVLGIKVPATPQTDQLDEDFRKRRMQQSVVELLSALVSSPAAFVFEDVHWMDPASQELLREIVSGIADRPWFVCATARPEGAGALGDTATTLDLEPLAAASAAELARTASNDMLLPQQAAALAERAAGNPLYLLELVDASGEGDVDALPDSVEALIAARIDRLMPADRNLLRFAAVLGQVADLRTLDDLTAAAGDTWADPPAVRSVASWSRVSELVERDGERLRFRQPLFHQVAYEGLPFQRRKALHGTLARLLEARTGDPVDRAEPLSLHFHAAGDHERSWKYSTAAAERARDAFAHVEAATFYRRAIDAAKRIGTVPADELVDAWEQLGLAMFQSARYSDAAAAFRQGRRLADSTVDAVRLLRREAAARLRLGEQTKALRALRQGTRMLSEETGREAASERVRLALLQARVHQSRGQHARAAELARIALVDAEVAEDVAGLGHAHATLHSIGSDVGDASRHDHGLRALVLFRQVGDLRYLATVLNALGADAYIQGRWDEATRLYTESLEALERSGNVLEMAVVSNNLAEILSDQGRLDEAAKSFRDAYRTFWAAGYREFALIALANLARAQARGGNFSSAAELFERAADEGSSSAAVSFTVRAFRAEMLVLRGRGDEARELLSPLRNSAPPSAMPLVRRLEGYALAQSGDPDAAYDVLVESVQLAEQAGGDFEAALSHHALAALATSLGEPAEGHRAEADATFRRLGVVSVPETPLPAGKPAGSV